ncbi:hypothetical protein AGOR_G00137620 [Albula goreensis]|uniref:Uncharacterized protein n=1 Tax=Albula goreensis TaxID=1534307 RepID=A0A8T3DEA3_9TELE|nr:hypothetical protein AGOR_G00137620 [Albula goreensis]
MRETEVTLTPRLAVKDHVIIEGFTVPYVFQRVWLTRLGTMTSVNSPACLAARNQFYRNLSPSTQVKSVHSHSGCLKKQRQVTVWVTTSTHQGLPRMMARGWWISVVLGNPYQTTKCLSPPGRVVK